MAAVRVAINGYGTIGKRVADAIRAQDDMAIVGVTKTKPDYEARLALKEKFPLYAANDEFGKKFEKEGIKIEGTLLDLLKKTDIVIDCTPEGVGEEFKPIYESAGVKAIFQGGEEHELTGFSFNSFVNYNDAWGRQFARVVSCNTTGLIRTLYPVDRVFGVESAVASLVRRAADPGESKKGPINAIEPDLHLPTHHGPDVQTVWPSLKIQTMAVKVPTTIMHLHCVSAKLKRKGVTAKEVLTVWDQVPRIRFVSGRHGVKTSAQVMEVARDLDRKRGDFNEIIVWEDGTHVMDGILYYYQAIHQESDVIPEIIDCIRAMMKIEPDSQKCIAKTDRALGIHK